MAEFIRTSDAIINLERIDVICPNNGQVQAYVRRIDDNDGFGTDILPDAAWKLIEGSHFHLLESTELAEEVIRWNNGEAIR